MRVWFAIGFYFLYWGVCYLATGTDRKNLAGLRSYPDEVQKCVRAHIGDVPKEKSMISVLAGNILLFTVVFSLLGLLLKNELGLTGFSSAFWYFLRLGEGLGVFDLLVIDLLWWRSTKRIRFSFLPEKQPYQCPTKHTGSFVRGIPMFALVAVLAALVTGKF